MAKRVLRYLKGTSEYSLKYECVNIDEFNLVGFSDSSFGSDPETRKSISGYLFLLGRNLLCYKSKNQNIVTTSTMEAEYVALCITSQQPIWLKNILSELLIIDSKEPVLIYEDNNSCLQLSKKSNT